LVLLWKVREQNVQGVCWVLLLFFKACNPLLTCSRLKHLICTNQQLPHKLLLEHETGGLGHSLAPRPVHISDLETSRASPVVSSSSLIANNLQSPAKNIDNSCRRSEYDYVTPEKIDLLLRHFFYIPAELWSRQTQV